MASRKTSSSSGGGGSGSNVPLSQIEKSVTHLLVATKQLLETLTQWSRGQATDTLVSDVYVRLGYEFNMACRAFTAINVDTSDLGNVPELLRDILESTLSQEASSESLEKYLPRIRDIIINLLHGLKRKQQKLRQKQARDRESSTTASSTDSAGRASSLSASRSTGSGLTSMLNESIDGGYLDGQASQTPQLAQLQQRSPSRDEVRGSSSPSRRFIPPRDQSRSSGTSDPSSLSSSAMQSIPVLPPYAEGSQNSLPTSSSAGELNIDAFPPPPPPKSQQSAFMALQRNGDHLERRASRRYSQYQIQKHLGSNFSTGVPLLPPQTTPIPNRGRGEVRESMRAVQVRNARSNSSTGRSAAGYDSSPMRVPSRVSEERDLDGAEGKEVVTSGAADAARRDDSPVAKTPDDKYPQPSATLNGPADLMPPMPVMPERGQTPPRRRGNSNESRTEAELQERAKSINATQAALVGETISSPASGRVNASPSSRASPGAPSVVQEPASKELTLFLQYKSKVKKFVLPEGYSELTMGRLQLAFIEKFSWNTQQNGADLPEIYIQDPVSGVRHELEDLSDIKDRTVLALNVEALDEVKRHIDEGIGALKSMVQQVKQNVDEQGAALQRVSDRQQEASKEMVRIATAPPAQPMTPPADSPRSNSMGSTSGMAPTASGSGLLGRGGKRFSNQQLAEVQSLRRDLAVLRQTYASFQSDMESSMTALRNKATNVKVAVAETAIPNVDSGKGQALVAAGRKKLSVESDRLVTKVDDLQDLVEDLRKDVVHRGVRPLPRQLETVTKDITQLAKDLKKMEETMKRDKPIWTKIWEKELEEVCKGRDELQLAEDLLVDLQDDLEKASETFALVEQATKEQMKDAGVNGAVAGAGAAGPGGLAVGGLSTANGGILGGQSLISRQLSLGLKSIGDNVGLMDPNAAKEGVLGEVRALQPNHENRLEAIERAEKLRQKELESRRVNPMMQELADFVEEGKLKKSGGFEEAERARKAKDDRIRREVWERQNGIVLDVPPEEEGEGGGGGGGGESGAAAAVEAGAV